MLNFHGKILESWCPERALREINESALHNPHTHVEKSNVMEITGAAQFCSVLVEKEMAERQRPRECCILLPQAQKQIFGLHPEGSQIPIF